MTIVRRGFFCTVMLFAGSRPARRDGRLARIDRTTSRHSLIGREIVAKRRAPDADWRKTPSDTHRAAAHKSGVRCPSLLAVRVLRRRNRVSPRAAARLAGLEAVSYLRKRLS
nr:hypothetical protein [Burkholderia pyrrocinia]